MIEVSSVYVCDVCGKKVSDIAFMGQQHLYDTSAYAFPSRFPPEPGWHWFDGLFVCQAHDEMLLGDLVKHVEHILHGGTK